MTRLTLAWRALQREQRLAALAALGLFISMLLPWYSKTNTLVIHDAVSSTQQSLSAFQAFSFVEAAVLLVSAGVLAMLFARAERRDFHLPGGDGTIVMVAGGWAALLIFYRLLDKPGLQGNQRITATVGVEWGIFIALLLALGLLYAGSRMRAAERAAPPLRRPRRGPPDRGPEPRPDPDQQETVRRPGRARISERPIDSQEEEEEVATISPDPSPAPRGARRRSRFPPAPADQMSFEEEPPGGG
jgi:hypothetical protein